MKAGPYIESGRTLATLLFVVLYFGFTQSNSYATHLEQTMEARQAFGQELVLRQFVPCSDFQKWRPAKPNAEPQATAILQWLQAGGYHCELPSIPWTNEIRLTPIGTGGASIFSRRDTEVLFRLEVSEYTQSRRWIARVTAYESNFSDALPAESPMVKVARRTGFKIEKDEDAFTLFSRFENDLLAKEVALPGSGFSFPVGRVVWVCFLVSFGMLILLRDRIQMVFEDPKLGRGEPWLILDARSWASSRLAETWMIGIFVGPWLLALATLRMTALYFYAQGRVASSFLNVAMFTGILAVAIAAGWTSLRIISDLLRLRRLQRHPERNWLNDPEISEP